MDRKNYPAAHSMDSFWFGLDKDGNIAVFDTGESGAIPTNAHSNPDGFYHLLDSLKKDLGGIRHFYLPLNPLEQMLSSYSEEDLKKEIEHRFMRNSIYSIAIELKNPKGIEYVSNKGITVKLHKSKEIYYLSRPSQEDVFGLSEIGLISGAIFDFDDERIMASLANSYYYDEKPQLTFGRGISDYKRFHIPKNPTKIEQLPEEMQEFFKSKLPIKFSNKEIIQPLKYGKGSATETYYIDEEGNRVERDYGE